ncbi:MAG: helix-turn-helix domain-containing protein [Deltaproteobacteria bacterium]|nr:helix-turn-helix domain-containing protein [Deltaproteobacteria bacterium]MBW1922751.1 helix-turn-helix domain-containing protein [Deltaproteobacteria bacterium]MBW1949726.1 helix-turn-helix domain-containing protein [Deltaproteobacteria bacterium]MBW2009911.1 helix-turn-helix domain-containing protein [Deltaproteobacteria bacterium]
MNKEKSYDVNKKYMTQQEVADLFRVKPATVKNWRDAGFLEYFQPPGSTRVLYPRKSVEALEESCTKREKAKIIQFKSTPAEVKRKVPGMSSKQEKKWRI